MRAEASVEADLIEDGPQGVVIRKSWKERVTRVIKKESLRSMIDVGMKR